MAATLKLVCRAACDAWESKQIEQVCADHAVLPSNDAFLRPGSEEAARARAAAPDTVGLAEAASFMVEWHALAARTGNASYAETADHVVHLLQQRHPKQVYTLIPGGLL